MNFKYRNLKFFLFENLFLTDVRRILYEIVRQILLKTLKSEHLVSVISTLKEKYPEICSMIVDVFSLIDIEVTTGEKNIREKFIITIATCKVKAYLLHGVLERLCRPVFAVCYVSWPFY